MAPASQNLEPPGIPARFRVLVAAIVVENDMDQLADRDLAPEAVEKAQELLVPVALHALAAHGPIEDVKRREQVVVGSRLDQIHQVMRMAMAREAA
jgi:hypothetical protein